MAITRGKEVWGEVEEGEEGIHGDGRRLHLGLVNTIQYTDNVL